jgi:hypothetical protein
VDPEIQEIDSKSMINMVIFHSYLWVRNFPMKNGDFSIVPECSRQVSTGRCRVSHVTIFKKHQEHGAFFVAVVCHSSCLISLFVSWEVGYGSISATLSQKANDLFVQWVPLSDLEILQ